MGVSKLLALGVKKAVASPAHTRSSFAKEGKKVTDEVALTAHNVRAMLGNMDPSLPKIKPSKKELLKKGKQVERALELETKPNWTKAEEQEYRVGSDAISELATTDLDYLESLLKGSTLTLDRPLYAARVQYDDVTKPHQPVSALVVDPRAPDFESSLTTYAGLDDSRSRVFKLPKGAEILHPNGRADPHEVLVTNKTLADAESAQTKDYIAAIKKGGALFGTAAAGTANSNDAEASPASRIVGGVEKALEKAPKQITALYEKAKAGDIHAEEQVKKYLVNKGAKAHETQAHFDEPRFLAQDSTLSEAEKDFQYGKPGADPYNEDLGDDGFIAYSPKGTSEDGYQELSYTLPRYLINPAYHQVKDHFVNFAGTHTRREWIRDESAPGNRYVAKTLKVIEVQSDLLNKAKKAEAKIPSYGFEEYLPRKGRSPEEFEKDAKSLQHYMVAKEHHYANSEVEDFLRTILPTFKGAAHRAAVKGPGLLKEAKNSAAYKARYTPFSEKVNWTADTINRQLKDALNQGAPNVEFILRDPTMDQTHTRGVIDWYENAYAGMVKKMAKRIGAKVEFVGSSSRSTAEKLLTDFQNGVPDAELKLVNHIEGTKGGLLIIGDLKKAYAKNRHVPTEDVSFPSDLLDAVLTVGHELNPRDYRKYSKHLKVTLPAGAAAAGITFPAFADEAAKDPEIDPEDLAFKADAAAKMIAQGTKASEIQKVLASKLGEAQGNKVLMTALQPKIDALRAKGVPDEQINQVLAQHGLSGSSPVQPDGQPDPSLPSLSEGQADISLHNGQTADQVPAGQLPRLDGPGTGKATGLVKALTEGPDLTLDDGSSLRDTIAQVKNFQMKYSDTGKSILGSLGFAPQYKAEAKQAQEASNKVLATVLKAKGLDFKTITPDGEVVVTDQNGQDVKYDETLIDSMLAMPYETAGFAIGAKAGALIGAGSPIPGGTAIGAALGSAIGDSLGRGADVVRNAMLTHYQISTADTLERMGDAATGSIVLDGLGLSAISLVKGTSKGVRLTGKAITGAYDKIIVGNVEGAYKTLLEGTNLNEAQARDLTDRWLKLVNEKKAPEGTLAEKKQVIRAVGTTTPEATSQVSAAVQSSISGGALLRAEVAQRARDLQMSAATLTSENVSSVVTEDLSNYVTKVNTFFDEAKKAGIEEMKSTPYVFDFHQTAVLPAMQKAATGLTNVDAAREFYRYVELIRDAGKTPMGSTSVQKQATTAARAETTAARAETTAARAKAADLRTKIAAAKKRAKILKTKKAQDRALAEAADLSKQLVRAEKAVTKATGNVVAKAQEVATQAKGVAQSLQPTAAKAHTFEDLLKLKAILNQLSADTRFKSATDFAQMKAAKASVDKEISAAAKKHMVDGKGWLKSWDAANVEYHKMKELQNNSLYKALTSDQVSADSAVKAITKALTYEGPKTFMQVMGKLPAQNRPLVEGAILQHLVAKHTTGDVGGSQAINFATLANEVNQLAFTQKATKDLKRTINMFADVFKTDHNLLTVTSKMPGPKFQNSLGLDPVSKAKIAISGVLFNAVRARLPGTNAGRAALSLQLGKLLDNPLNSKAIEAVTKMLPNDPELATALHTLAAEYTKFGKPEHYGKVPIYRVFKPGAENAASQTVIGKGVLHYADKATARRIAKLTGSKVKEVWQVHKAIATPETVSRLLGREATPADFKDPEVLDQLKRSYAGLAVSEKVVLFKKNTM